ncbi:MAG: glycosyltransferase family 39 protein [Phycisphaerales bacterium]|nr:MAG: glycosyltransferase family 39 protein [Phycisphaerales bacterium]
MNTRWYILVFIVALVARAGWGGFKLARAESSAALEFPDERQYWLMADSLAGGDGLRDEFGFRATRMPLYPATLSLAVGLEHGVIVAKVAHWVIGALAATLATGVAQSLLGRRVGVLAGLMVACDPFLVFTSSLLLTETLFIAALAGLWWIVAPTLAPKEPAPSIRRWCAIGCVSALCVHVRESSLGLVVATLCLLVVFRRFERRALAGASIAVGIVILGLVPWAARNARVTGSWCWLTHRTGVSLYDGVRLEADGSSDLAEVQQMPEVWGLDEVEWNRYFLEESLLLIRSDPARIIRLAGTKWLRTWNPFPNVGSYQSLPARLASGAWALPVLALAVAGTTLLLRIDGKGRLRTTFFLLLPALYVSVLHSLFVGSVRYRLPAMPMLEILAAFALVTLFERMRRNPVPEAPDNDV